MDTTVTEADGELAAAAPHLAFARIPGRRFRLFAWARMGGRSGRHRRCALARGLARRSHGIRSAALGRRSFFGRLSLRGGGRLAGAHRSERSRGRPRPSAERRLETTAQGAAFVAAARAAWDCEPLRRLDDAPDGRIAYPIAVAAAASGHGLPLGASLEAFALAQAANLVSAALRLGPIGQTDGQKILAALLPPIRALAREAHRREPRRSRRRGVSLRHRRHAAREPVFEAVPVMTAPSQPLRVGVGGPSARARPR